MASELEKDLQVLAERDACDCECWGPCAHERDAQRRARHRFPKLVKLAQTVLDKDGQLPNTPVGDLRFRHLVIQLLQEIG